ncbi:S1/P1 Nuclease [Phenylobacterium sp. J367]|uniref:S1/P1 Nuclease n=1 Tax=Phenylobacterium sp. J367 TaxID=2898435 RepID=UPI0021506C80|nr:S1/P1 Nuclease [Phenylobacterium sp. J367]MCR5879790.1 S1/P1 Nuclease [Phenylobacterium sp. J367]
MQRLASALAVAALIGLPSHALAWGNAGHRMVGEAAAKALPTEVPAFLRSKGAIADLGELSREPDRSKGAGRIHDHDRDAAHFVDLGEDGKVLGGPDFLPFQATKADYETALRAHNIDMWKAGYLQFSIIDRRQQLTLDFAYWRILKAAEANPKWKKNRAWFKADRIRREGLILKTMGELAHFVGDGSQPLHVSIHYNGWGDYPNPNGYSTARLHGPFESEMVKARVNAKDVEARVAPLRVCDCSLEQRTADYLLATGKLVIPFYEMEKAGGLAEGDPRGPEFATRQLAIGASELRDLTVESWRASAGSKVGWRPVAVADVESGKVDPYPNLYGID